MTPEQIRLVRETWDKVAPIAGHAAELFYERLFEIDPSTRPLFRATDLAEQRRKLMHVLGVAVQGLEQLDALLPVVQELGRRHSAYGVRDAHYGFVGAALLWTLEQGLGPAWTPQVSAVWTRAYEVLSTTMRDAARAQAPRTMADSRLSA
jgi:hemoglobin-like flavoprotein